MKQVKSHARGLKAECNKHIFRASALICRVSLTKVNANINLIYTRQKHKMILRMIVDK